MDAKKLFEEKNLDDEQVFLKTGKKLTIESSQKTALNRKANMLFNNGDIEGAKRIFITTGYSDGLSRVGDFYRSKGRIVDALQMYWIAPDKRKSNELIVELSIMIKGLIHSEEKEG